MLFNKSRAKAVYGALRGGRISCHLSCEHHLLFGLLLLDRPAIQRVYDGAGGVK